ncbi:MAG TPA: hypothetical protein DDZ96_08710 [Porphyromonadaceae bacterium]|jgi:hypothetical protein|nr:hypothetical protein [Porphyromonadaceae bacterium]HBL33885.1 hypothetical protein [Porphyromonadaceae bacterium]HBX18838.1 hypothetical protein [Porphyromonadaceae bacterium]HCM20567.1 hypothetical protein [Porphyromonadaceae bacterium]
MNHPKAKMKFLFKLIFISTCILSVGIGLKSCFGITAGHARPKKVDLSIRLSSSNLYAGDKCLLSVYGNTEKGENITPKVKIEVLSDNISLIRDDGQSYIHCNKPGRAAFKVHYGNLSKEVEVTVKETNPSKKESSFYTQEKIKQAAENILKYDWAKGQKDRVVSRANHWLKNYSPKMLYYLVPSQSIPRSMAVNSLHGCLACGKNIDRYGNYPYVSDVDELDWKLTCPNCGLSFPSNNFREYYAGGLDQSGNFIPELAEHADWVLKQKGEKGNLINRYTEGLSDEEKKKLRNAGVSEETITQILSDSTWGVDDGMGYRFNLKDKQQYGNPYTYIAYYNHWTVWYKMITPMLEDFSLAYLFTKMSSDPSERAKAVDYAEAAIILLDRIADYFPEYHLKEFPRSGYYGFTNSDGHHSPLNRGRIVGSIWDNDLIKKILYAYDAVFPAIDMISSKATSTLTLLSGNTAKATPARIKSNFEDGFLREIPKAYTQADLQGNPGMHQSTLALAAVVFNANPETSEWLNTVYKSGYSDWKGDEKRDGGNIMNIIVNRIDRHGQGDEVGLLYNSLWLGNWLTIANIMNGYTLDGQINLDKGIEPDLFKNQRFKKLFEANYPLLLTDNYFPHIGDSEKAGNPGHSLIKINHLITGYAHYKTPELAQAIYLLNGKSTKNIHLDIFSPNPSAIAQEIDSIIKVNGELTLKTSNFPAYGLSILRDRDHLNELQRTLWMFYGARSASHNHADPLNLGYIAYDLDLMPDFGYPNTLGGNNNPEQQWNKSTPAHNTVSFDKLGYNGHVIGFGTPTHFLNTEQVKMVQVEVPNVSNSGISYAEIYNRTSGLIKIDEESSYIIDFFRVKSDHDYTYNFHTAEVSEPHTRYQGLSFSATSSITYHANTLRNVRQAEATGEQFSIDWNILDTWNRYGKGAREKTDVHLQITMLGNYKFVTLGEAVPPTNVSQNPQYLPILQVSGTGLTTFISLIEAYKTTGKIKHVEEVEITEGTGKADKQKIKAVKVELFNGRRDYIISAMDTHTTYKIDNKFQFSGAWGVYSLFSDGRVQCIIHDGTVIGPLKARKSVEGVVTGSSTSLEENSYIDIKVDEPVASAESMTGEYIYIQNDDILETKELRKYNAVYKIKSVQPTGGRNYRLYLSDSIIRGWNDIHDYGKGFLIDFNRGAQCRIPLYSHKTF